MALELINSPEDYQDLRGKINRMNIELYLEAGLVSEVEYTPDSAVTELTDDVVWFENNFYIPDAVTEFSFIDDGIIHVWTWNVDTWDEETFTAVEYAPSPGPITEISNDVTHDGNYFIIPDGVTSFTFKDNDVDMEATFSVDTWSFEAAPVSTIPTLYSEITDDFQLGTHNSDLNTLANWDTVQGTMQLKNLSGDIVVVGASLSPNLSFYSHGQNCSADQYVEALVFGLGESTRRIGVAARIHTVEADNMCYTLDSHDNGTLSLRRVTNTSTVTLATSDAGFVVAGDTIGLLVVGDELKCFKNEELITSFGDDGVVIDDNYTQGRFGVVGYQNPQNNLPNIDNFRAGSVDEIYQY